MTPAQVKAAVASKLETLMSAESLARLASDFDISRERIPAGAARYQLQAWVGPQTAMADANPTFHPAMSVRLLVHYHLGASEAERTYTDGRMQTVLSALSDPEWWMSVSGVERGLDEDPEIPVSSIARVGDVVSFLLTLTLTVNVNA